MIFTKELEKILQELIVLAKKQGLHTMIGVDAENQSSVTFHEKFDSRR
jgi:phosphinothricin acetyltransferase